MDGAAHKPYAVFFAFFAARFSFRLAAAAFLMFFPPLSFDAIRGLLTDCGQPGRAAPIVYRRLHRHHRDLSELRQRREIRHHLGQGNSSRRVRRRAARRLDPGPAEPRGLKSDRTRPGGAPSGAASPDRTAVRPAASGRRSNDGYPSPGRRPARCPALRPARRPAGGSATVHLRGSWRRLLTVLFTQQDASPGPYSGALRCVASNRG